MAKSNWNADLWCHNQQKTTQIRSEIKTPGQEFFSETRKEAKTFGLGQKSSKLSALSLEICVVHQQVKLVSQQSWRKSLFSARSLPQILWILVISIHVHDWRSVYVWGAIHNGARLGLDVLTWNVTGAPYQLLLEEELVPNAGEQFNWNIFACA